MAAIVATALALGIMAVFAMPARYSAEAYIRGVVAGSNTVVKDDTTRPIGVHSDWTWGGYSRRRRTYYGLYQLAQRVVEHLGLERLRPELNESPSLLARFFGHAAASFRTTGEMKLPRRYCATCRSPATRAHI